MLRESKVPAALIPVSIAAGAIRRVPGAWQIPKKDLVATLQVLLQTRKLRISELLPDSELLAAELLAAELSNFKASPMAGFLR